MPNTRRGLAATHHYVCKAIGNVGFPASKEDISRMCGNITIQLNYDETKTIDELLLLIVPNDFSCAAAFFNALSASLLKREHAANE